MKCACAAPSRPLRRRLDRASSPGMLVGVVAALAEVLRLDVADVQKAVAADAEVDEGRLDARLEVDDLSLVDVADVVVLAGPFDVELFQHSIFNDGDPAFFRLADVDQHFFLHKLAFCEECEGDPGSRQFAYHKLASRGNSRKSARGLSPPAWAPSAGAKRERGRWPMRPSPAGSVAELVRVLAPDVSRLRLHFATVPLGGAREQWLQRARGRVG